MSAALALIHGTTATARHNDGNGNNNGNLDQQLAVPAYIDPTSDPTAWTDLTQTETDTLGIVVANVDSGPDSQAVPAWASAIDATHAAGAKVLGYVDTGYLGSPITGFSNGLYTRSSLTGFQAWLPQIEADINAWYQFYGNDLDGIFFDEATNTCGPTPTSDLYAQEYQTLTAYVKEAHPGAVTVLNPGTAVPSCYENSADVLVTFEGSYGDYTGNPVSPVEAYQPLSWSPVDPDKLWHIVYGTATQAEMEQVMALSKSRDAGYVYVTNLVPANPYDALPPQSYWQDEQDESYPFGNPGSAPPQTPSDLSLTTSNQWPWQGDSGTTSTQVQFSWHASAGVSAPVVAYDVYQNGVWLGAIGAGTLSFTASGLSPSTKYTFAVDARDSAGNVSNQSSGLTVTTPASAPIPPSAPSDVTVTAGDYTTVTLSWSPVSAPGQSVGAYIINENSAPILTVPASATTITVQGLQPGPTTYTFSVQAVGSTGNVSPPGNVVSDTTTPLPGGQEITSPSAVDNGNGTLTYSANFLTPFAFRRVFISTGTTPCWTTGNATPICSDYLIENNEIYHYAGAGTDFTWTIVGTIAPSVSGTDNYAWTIPSADIGTPATQVDLFNGDGYSPITYTALVNLPAAVPSATDVVTFDSQGGSAVASISGLDGTTITLPAAPTLAGSTFDGWFARPPVAPPSRRPTP